MKRLNLFLIFILSIISLNVFGQGATCATADPFCTGTIYEFPAGINLGVAETGPDYGCLSSVLNPVWYYLLIDQPGNIVLDIHSNNGENIDYICWGPFTSLNNCGNLTSTNIVDCGNNVTNQEWCNIPNAQTGKYYILFFANNSNQATHIIFSQYNIGQLGAGNTNCSTCACYFDNITYSVNPCNSSTNLYSINGNILFHFDGTPLTAGNLTITESSSGGTISFSAPFISPQTYNFINLPSDGLQHTLTATFTDAPDNVYIVTYTAPDTCHICTINAGNSIQVCGLTATLNAIENIGDVNTHWVQLSGITFDSINSPTSTATASVYGTYNLIWQIMNNLGLTCTDTITVEFIDPALCTSVIENNTQNLITVFPNPSVNGSSKIKYSSNIYDKFSIKIINIQGIEVFRKSISKNTASIEIQIDTSGLINGYYLVEINDGQKIIRKSFVVQNIF